MVNRSKHLFEALTPRERALAVLGARKRNEEPDPAILSMPPAQQLPWMRYAKLLMATTGLGHDVICLQQLVVAIELRREQWLMAHLRETELAILGGFIRDHVPEAITASAYADREQELRTELVPVAEFAELLAERRQETSAAQDVGREDSGPRQTTSAKASGGLVSDTRRELADLVATGVLRGRKVGSRLCIENGSFYAWVGMDMPVYSADCCDYEVFPDIAAETVAWHQQARRELRDVVARNNAGDHVEESWAETLAIAVRDGVQASWSTMRVLEIVVDEIASEEFDGEDPLRPAARSGLDDCRLRLIALHTVAQTAGDTFPLLDPDPRDVDALRRVVRGQANQPPARLR